MAIPSEVTSLLLDMRAGKREVMDQLFPMVYDELRHIAHNRLRHHAQQDTINTTALVHEAYLRLIDQTLVTLHDRAHFFALAARAMRFILIDYARHRLAQKRGGNLQQVSMDENLLAADEQANNLLALDEALTRLAKHDARLALVVEYRFFGGMTIEESATVIGISESTVKRDWEKARLLLYDDMKDGGI